MPRIKLTQSRGSDDFSGALRRFKRACEKAGILTETRRREFYEKPTAVRKRKAAAAKKRAAKQRRAEDPVRAAAEDRSKGGRGKR